MKIKGKSLQLKLMSFSKHYPEIPGAECISWHLLTQAPQDSFQNRAAICTQGFGTHCVCTYISCGLPPSDALFFLVLDVFISNILSVCLFFRVLFPCIGKINWYWPYYPLKYLLERLWHLWLGNVLELNSLLLKSWRRNLYCITVFAGNTCPPWDEVFWTKTTWVFICLL